VQRAPVNIIILLNIYNLLRRVFDYYSLRKLQAAIKKAIRRIALQNKKPLFPLSKEDSGCGIDYFC